MGRPVPAAICNRQSTLGNGITAKLAKTAKMQNFCILVSEL
jgi:hypothetical protein